VAAVGKIIVLPEEISGKIAAGEVIEGPFSIVRELIDNAMDADATHIKVTIHNGGKDFIQVTDNGSGMSEEDASLSIQKHTTSKIRKIEDIQRVSTMGFRGEALSSICAVSDFSMLTKSGVNKNGVKLTCSFGNDPRVVPGAANPGTEITVRNLFHNLPARRKFLRSNRAENARIREEVLKKAISSFRTGFTYISDDKMVFSLLPRESERERIEDLFGKDVNESLMEIIQEEEEYSLHVLISNKNSTLPNRNGQFLFINRRPIVDRALSFALNGPARGIVPAGRYVYAFVFIGIAPSLVDINVHPAKKEMRIKTGQRIFSALQKAVEKNLLKGFYPGAPPDDAGGYGDITESGERTGSPISQPAVSGPPGPGFFHQKDLGLDLPIQPVHAGIVSEKPPEKALPAEQLFYRGVLFHTYIIFESEELLLLIDQHAAHERILFERMKDALYGEKPVKNLLIPINFTPPRSQYDEILENIDAFREAGLEIEPFGDESFNLRTIPGFVPENREEETVTSFLEEFLDGKISADAQEIEENFLKLASCRNAIKEGDDLREEEARSLIKELSQTKIPYICPHGRPTFIKMTKADLEKSFKRRR
jgi:DNA mismatch repair protein MutL